MKKWLLTAAVCVFAAAFLFGCGKSGGAADPETSGMEAITYKDLYKANQGGRLLEKYGSVQYELFQSSGRFDDKGAEVGKTETWTLFQQDGEAVLMKETDGKERIVYADGTCYYENASNEKNILYRQGWFMNNSYEDYMTVSVDEFLLDPDSGEDFDSIEEEDGTYVLFSYVGENDGEKYYYRYTVEKESLEIKIFEAVIAAENGEEWIVSHGEVLMGAQAELPAYVDEMKQAEQKRSVTIHREAEEDIEVKLPENVTLLVLLEDGYSLYADKKKEMIFDDAVTERNEAGAYGNAECYLIYNAN